MSKSICRICLRTDVKICDIDETLFEFHDKLSDYSIHEDPKLKYCSICKYQLTKLFDFSRKCRLAQHILKEYMIKSKYETVFPDNLHEMLPPSTLEIHTAVCIQTTNRNSVKPTQRIINRELNAENGFSESSNGLNLKKIHPSFEFRVEDSNSVKYSHSLTKQKNYGKDKFKDGFILNNPKQMVEPFRNEDNGCNASTDVSVVDDIQTNRYLLVNHTDGKLLGVIQIQENEDSKIHNNNFTSSSCGNHSEDQHKERTIPETQEHENEVSDSEDSLEHENKDTIENDSCDSASDSEIVKRKPADSKTIKKKINGSIASFEKDMNDDGSTDTEKHEEMRKYIILDARGLKNAKTIKKVPPPNAIKKKRKKKQMSLRTQKMMEKLKVLEKTFEIELFTTKQEAIDEMEQRKTSDWFLNAKYKCEICYIVFRWQKVLDYHKHMHDPSAGDIVCDICQIRFANKRRFSTHFRTCHAGKFKCKMCPLITYQKGTMQRHYELHMGKRYTCEVCQRSFRNASTYYNHKIEHETSEKHVCVTCAKTFLKEHMLLKHRRLIHKTSSMTDSISSASCACAPCGLTFANERVYILHIRDTKAHPEQASTIIGCKSCGDIFETIWSLKQHMRQQHIRTYRFQKEKVSFSGSCSICGAVATSKIWMSRHMMEQHPDSEYVRDLERRRTHMCDTCGKCFVTIYALRDHMNIHTGATPYACAKCPRRFANGNNLRIHAGSHEPPKYKCKVCGKMFVRPSGLFNHMRSHIKLRRYKCPVCDKGFLRASAMREHLRGVHYQQRRERKQRLETQRTGENQHDDAAMNSE